MYSVGIDIGGTSIKSGIVDEDGNILAQSAIPTVPSKGFELMVKEMAEEVDKLLSDQKISIDKVKGIGVGIPGIADNNSGIVRVAVNLGWRNVDLRAEFKKYFNTEIGLSNDANCAALGEQRFGSGRGFSDVVFVTIGTGVGSGIVVNGKLVAGNGSAGGESGHIVIVYDGNPCNCGRRGCWEAYASATALIGPTKKKMEEYPDSIMYEIAKAEGKVSGRTAFRAMDAGDVPAKEVVEQYLDYVASGLISLTNVLHPEAFLIGGGVSHEGDNLILPLKAKIDEYVHTSGMYPEVEVKQATLGNSAGLLGASALV